MSANRELAHRTALFAALALLGDLLLSWHHTSAAVAGVVGVEASSHGYTGWGVLAAVGALALVSLELTRLRGGRERPRAALAAAGITLAATVLAVSAPGAEVSAPGVAVEAAVRQWPAWAGLALAVTLVAAELAASRRTARIHA